MPAVSSTKNTQIVYNSKSTGSYKPSKANWLLNGGVVVSTLVSDISKFTSVVGLQDAAILVTYVLSTIEKVKANKEDFQIIAEDALGLILAIYTHEQKAEDKGKWQSPEISQMVKELKESLKLVNEIAERHAKRGMITRVVYNMTDAGKIRQTREKIKTAVDKFQVISHLKTNELLLDVIARQKQLSEQVENRNDADNAEQEEHGEEDDDDEDDDRDDDDDDDDDEEPTTPVMKRRKTPAPTPPVGMNSAAIHGFSFSNSGSGQVYNQNVGNIINTNFSNIGNNRSRNYIYR